MPFVEIGCSPNEEDCVQVGSNREHLMGKELEIYKNQLTRAFPPPEGCYFKVKWNSHDFGRYGEVRAVFPEDSEEGEKWALEAENGVDHWDAQAVEERRSAGL